jgi:hypothetical protein
MTIEARGPRNHVHRCAIAASRDGRGVGYPARLLQPRAERRFQPAMTGSCTLAVTSTTGTASCQLTFTQSASGRCTITGSYGGDGAHATSGESVGDGSDPDGLAASANIAPWHGPDDCGREAELLNGQHRSRRAPCR